MKPSRRGRNTRVLSSCPPVFGHCLSLAAVLWIPGTKGTLGVKFLRERVEMDLTARDIKLAQFL